MKAALRTLIAILFIPLAASAVDATTVFNEVMYHPPNGADSEWIEVYNQMAVNMDLSGWRITGGVNFTFPENTTIPAGGALVVASNPSALQTSAGITGVLGPWTGALDNGSETIRLLNRIGRVMDEFHYEDSGSFPVAADAGGVALAKRAPDLASTDTSNWTYSGQLGGTPGAANFPGGQVLGAATTLAAFADTWNFNQSGANLGATWAQTSYSPGVGGWQSGPGVFAFESDPLPLAVGTTLNDPGASVVTQYFQRTFEFSGDSAQTALQLTTLLDDGAVVYLNGFEVARINMPAGAVTNTTRAAAPIDTAVLSAPLTLPSTQLVGGANVLSVEVHQSAETSGGALVLVQEAGTMDAPNNLALASKGAIPFAKDLLPGYPTIHNIPNLNNGTYGNSSSWIGNSNNSFCGINLGATPVTLRGVAWGRDNTGTYNDRTLGTYTLQYTTAPNPGAATPDSSWVTIGSVNYTGPSGPLFTAPSRRHRFNFAPVAATGVRLVCPGNGLGTGACIDELELYADTLPVPQRDVVFGAQLVAREVLPAPGSSQLVINEISGSTDATWRIELRNTGATNINLGGLVLASSNAPAGYVLPAQTLAPGELLVLDQTQVGFRPLLNDRVFLYNVGRTALFDAVLVRPSVRARSGGDFLTPTGATFGAENTFDLESDIVINELMYHFPPNPSVPGVPVTDNPEEWIELHNRSGGAVSLAGWTLDTAVEFTFPPNASIPAGDYLVVAKDAAALAAKWPEVAGKIIGNFTSNLANSGERIVLKDANGNPADEVRYFTGGAWPALPDGGGASLELRGSRADNANGAAWAASDESADTTWQTVTYRMVAAQTFGQVQWNEFRIGMLTDGECLIDDVSVLRDPDGVRQQLIQGGDFESLTNKWRLLGNHGTSAFELDPANPSNHVLHVRATGTFAFNHNHIESTFVGNTAIVNGQLYEVSFRARWLAGSNQLNTRAYFSRLARTTELAMPTRIGTPGAQNSRFATNIGPTLDGLAHAPVVPNASQPVTVSVRAADPDQVGAVTLRYALNGSASFASVAMTHQGSGLYSAPIPGFGAATIVQFYVEAQDSTGAVAQLPARGPAARALYVVNDGRASNVPAHELRIILLPAENASLLATLNRLSDARTPGTAIYRRSEVFYDVGVRLQGTAAGRVRDGEDYPGYDIGFPADHLFRGVHDSVNIDRSGRGPVVRGQDEIYVKHMFNRAGVPCTYDDLCYLITPATFHTGTAILQMAGYERTFVESQFHEDGSVFNLDGTYEPSTSSGGVEGLKNPVPLATQLQTDFTNLGNDKEQYRPALEIRAGRRRDDYTGLIAFCQTMALPTAQLAQQIGARMDVDEWMRCTALYSLCGINDAYMTGGFVHNLRVYVPPDGFGVVALPWDMDFVFSHGSGSAAILASGNLRRVIELPAYKRLYYGHLQDLCNTVFNSGYMAPWLAHYGAVVGQNMSGQSGYIEARRASVLTQLPAQVTFSITTNGGADFSINTATATLAGNGWVNIREFRRADTGAVLPAEWTGLTSWRLNVAVNFGANPITLQAYDFQGQLLATDTITITSTLPAPTPRDFLRVTELHYHPAPPMGAELNVSTDKDDFEFIELRNLGTQTLDVSGCALTVGVDFVFPGNTTLAAGESILVVRSSAAFQARYGAALRIAGAYGPADSLSNSGETLTLVDATGAVIQSFTYDDAFPWPDTADGAGHSVVPIAPHLALDRSLAVNWRPSTSIGGNPGANDTSIFTGSPASDLDQDGLLAYLEYGLGTSDTSPASGPGAWSLAPSGTDVHFTFTRRLSADDIVHVIEVSNDLGAWDLAATQLISSTQNGAVLTETHRITPPLPGQPRFFVRLRVDAR